MNTPVENYRLLAVSTEKEANIGDYIQALASAQFLPRIDGFVERERLRDYDDGPCRVIMNGWYIHNKEQWPPSDSIDPLFVAVHFNSTAKDVLTSTASIDYLKSHEPIGCRDMATAEMLQERGVDAYFTGCMTLTLGNRYHSDDKNGKVFFVDPYFVTEWNVSTTIRNAIFLTLHFRKILKISKKHPEKKKGLRKMMILTTFFREYRKIFTEETLTEAVYICQQDSHWKEDFATNEERLTEAKRIVKEYAGAALVVTSRIHCALPCLGLETPVIYVENAQQSTASACRFGGLRELFTILRWNTDHLEPEFPIEGRLSSSQNIPCNKENWRPLAEKLSTRCINWITKQ